MGPDTSGFKGLHGKDQEKKKKCQDHTEQFRVLFCKARGRVGKFFTR